MLLHTIVDDEILGQIKGVSESEIVSLENMFSTYALTSKFTCTISHAVDDNNVHYRDVEFVVTSRYTDENGDNIVSGDMFSANTSAMIRQIREIRA